MKEGWEYKKLGEVCEIYQPKTISTEMMCDNGKYPVYGANGIIGKFNEYNHDESEILMTCRGATCGSLNISEPFSWINGNAMVIHPKEKELFYSQKFLLYILKNLDLSNVITGCAQPQITRLSLSPTIIPVPPLEEQKRIAEELDLLSGIIVKQKQQLKELDTLAHSIFYDMFGDPVNNEKGWEIKKLCEIGETGSGGTPSKDTQEYWDNGHIPWIGSNMCQNSFIYMTDGKYITELGLEKSSAKLLPINTVLIALVGTTIGKVGLLKIESSTNQNIAFVKPNNNLNSLFLFYGLMNLYSLFQNIGKGKFKMANLKFIRNLPIILPPLHLQNLFAEKIEAIEKQKEAVGRSIEETQKLFDYAMDKYFG